MKTRYLLASTAAAAALPLTALAHVGSDGGGHHNFLDSLTHAFAHPFGGADHLAAMLAVGAWSALACTQRGAAWRAPAAFVPCWWRAAWPALRACRFQRLSP